MVSNYGNGEGLVVFSCCSGGEAVLIDVCARTPLSITRARIHHGGTTTGCARVLPSEPLSRNLCTQGY